MKKTPFLNMYKKYMETGIMEHPGLCCCLDTHELKKCKNVSETFFLFYPTTQDFAMLDKEGKSTMFWASQMTTYNDSFEKTRRFNELRQTIVLFCAAINDEI